MKHQRYRPIKLLFTLLACIFVTSGCQDDQSKETSLKSDDSAALKSPQAAQDVSRKHFRFLPLGEMPPWEQKLIDGIRVGKEPPPFSLPPREVSLHSGEADLPIALRLGSFTERVTIDGKTPSLILNQGEMGSGDPWLTSKMPESNLNLGILYRDHESMTWDQPKMLLLKDDTTSFPAGKIRLVNVSDRLILWRIGDSETNPSPKLFGLPPGKVAQKSLRLGKNQIRVGYVTKAKQKQWIWEGDVILTEGQRLQTFFYRAQGEKPRQKVLFHHALEFPPD